MSLCLILVQQYCYFSRRDNPYWHICSEEETHLGLLVSLRETKLVKLVDIQSRHGEYFNSTSRTMVVTSNMTMYQVVCRCQLSRFPYNVYGFQWKFYLRSKGLEFCDSQFYLYLHCFSIEQVCCYTLCITPAIFVSMKSLTHCQRLDQQDVIVIFLG